MACREYGPLLHILGPIDHGIQQVKTLRIIQQIMLTTQNGK